MNIDKRPCLVKITNNKYILIDKTLDVPFPVLQNKKRELELQEIKTKIVYFGAYLRNK